MQELLYFILIVIVSMFGFGIATQSLMYPNQQLSSTILANVFLPSYFLIGADNIIRDQVISGINGDLNCMV
jgi:hypothetical protein